MEKVDRRRQFTVPTIDLSPLGNWRKKFPFFGKRDVHTPSVAKEVADPKEIPQRNTPEEGAIKTSEEILSPIQPAAGKKDTSTPLTQDIITAIDPLQEERRTTITEVQEIDPSDETDENKKRLWRYVHLLNNPANRVHFAEAPRSTAELKKRLLEKEVHGLALINDLGETVGFGTIRDPKPGYYDHWLEHLVIENRLQNRKREGGPKHVGLQCLDKIAEWAFEKTKTYDGRERETLYAAVIMFVPRSDRAASVFDRSGFKFAGYSPGIVKILMGGKEVRRTTYRFVLERDDWRAKRHYRSHQETTPQQ